MDVKELIKSYGQFYHITDSGNESNIMKNGLLPTLYEEMDYHIECPKIMAQLCVTPPHKLHELYQSFKCNNPMISYTIFEIPAVYISTINFGYDWTFYGTHRLFKMDYFDGIKKSIDEFGTLACFDVIPKEILKKYELK